MDLEGGCKSTLNKPPEQSQSKKTEADKCQLKKKSRIKLDLSPYESLFWSRFGLLLHFFLFRLSFSALAAPSSLKNTGFSTGERLICKKKMSFLRLVVVSELIPTEARTKQG